LDFVALAGFTALFVWATVVIVAGFFAATLLLEFWRALTRAHAHITTSAHPVTNPALLISVHITKLLPQVFSLIFAKSLQTDHPAK
jgi:hypothetical protein